MPSEIHWLVSNFHVCQIWGYESIDIGPALNYLTQALGLILGILSRTCHDARLAWAADQIAVLGLCLQHVATVGRLKYLCFFKIKCSFNLLAITFSFLLALAVWWCRALWEGMGVCRVTGLKDWPSEVRPCRETCRAASKLGAEKTLKPFFF